MNFEYKKGVLLVRIENNNWLQEIDSLLEKETFKYIILNLNYKNKIKKIDINKIISIYTKQLLMNNYLGVTINNFKIKKLLQEIVIKSEYEFMRQITL